MKIALCLRGVAFNKYINWTGQTTTADFRIGAISFIEQLLKPYEVDVFIHAWVNKMHWEKDIVSCFNPKKYIIETQKDFTKNYQKIPKAQKILYKYYTDTHKNEAKDIKKEDIDLDFLNFLQIRFSSEIFLCCCNCNKLCFIIAEFCSYDITSNNW